jgi:hypothetical protein
MEARSHTTMSYVSREIREQSHQKDRTTVIAERCLSLPLCYATLAFAAFHTAFRTKYQDDARKDENVKEDNFARQNTLL